MGNRCCVLLFHLVPFSNLGYGMKQMKQEILKIGYIFCCFYKLCYISNDINQYERWNETVLFSTCFLLVYVVRVFVL